MRGPFSVRMPDLSPHHRIRFRVQNQRPHAQRVAGEAGGAQHTALLASGLQPLAILASAPLKRGHALCVTPFLWFIAGLRPLPQLADIGSRPRINAPHPPLAEGVDAAQHQSTRPYGPTQLRPCVAASGGSERATIGPTRGCRFARVNPQATVELITNPCVRAVPDPRIPIPVFFRS